MPSEFDVFLSYHWRDHGEVLALADQLRTQGLKVFLDRWYLTPGQPWPQELERVLAGCGAVAVCVGPGEMGPWQQREKVCALERQGREPGFPVIPVLLPGADPVLGFLGQNTWVDFRTGLDQPMVLAILAEAIRREPPGPALRERIQQTLATLCPYKGLAYFREEDADFFFGRDRAIDTLYGAVQRRPCVAVVGASGSGKSSVVRAGLVPQLRRDTQTPWEIVTAVPGDRPLYNLAAGLMPLLEPARSENDRLIEIGKQAQAFQDGTVRVRDVVERILQKQSGTKRFLLIVDQWEELYTLAPEADGRRFIDGLLEATAANVLAVVLTLRGDFMGRAIGYRPLADRLQDAQVNLGPMIREELQRAIEAPAHQVGAGFEAGLVERILDDVGDEPGHLPLVEFVLQQLWHDPDRQGRALRHAAYDAMGGVDEALARYADAVLAQWPEQQERLRQIFVQLVRPGEGTEDTRQVATRTQVGATNWPLVTRLADARLVVTGRDKASGEETVEVVHEALIQHWQPLHQWMRKDRAFRLWQNRLRESIQEWEAQQRDDGALLRGARLVEAEEQLLKHTDEIAPQEREYILASKALRDSEIKARQKRTRNMLIGLVAGLMLALGLAWWANLERQHAEASETEAVSAKQLAESQRDRALRTESRSLTKLSREQTIAGYPEIGALLALEALPKDMAAPDRPYVAEAEAALYQAMLAPQKARTFPGKYVTLSNDGKRLLTREFVEVYTPSIYRLWDTANGQRLSEWKMLHEVEFYSPDAARVVSLRKNEKGSGPGEIQLWDTETGTLITVLQDHPREVHCAEFRAAFSSDSRRVATAHAGDPDARLWDAKTGRLIAVLKGHKGGVLDVVFSPDGRYIATASKDGSVRLWDGIDGHALAVLSAPKEKIYALLFSPNGNRLLSLSEDGTGRLWNTESRTYIARLKDAHGILTGGGGRQWRITNAAFSPDGARVAVSAENIAAVWDTATGAVVAVLRGHDRRSALDPNSNLTAQITHVAFSPDGRWVLTASQDGTSRLWDAAAGTTLAVLPAEDTSQPMFIQSALFSPDGGLVVRQSNWSTQIWDSVTRTLLARLKSEFSEGISPDGRYLYADQIHLSDETHVWDVTRGDLLQVVHQNTDWISRVAFDASGAYFVTASGDGTARLWETASGREVAVLSGHGENLPETVEWKATDGDYRIYARAVRDAGFSPDGKRIVTASSDGTARVWDAVSGRPLAVLRGHGDDAGPPDNAAAWFKSMPVNRATFSSDGTRIVTAGDDHTARIWDANTGRQLVVLRGHAKAVNLASFSPDGKLVLTDSQDETVRLWDAATGAQIGLLMDPSVERSARSPMFSADGRFVLTLQGYTLRLWDIVGKAEHSEELQGATSSFVEWMETGGYASCSSGYGATGFSADGRLVAAALWCGASRTWRLATRERLAEHPECEAAAVLVSFAPDGARAVTVRDDGNVWLWDALSGAQLAKLFSNQVVGSPRACLTRHHDDRDELYPATSAAALSPDGHYIVTGSMDGTVRILQIFPTTQELVNYARRLVTRQLTADERRRLLLDPN